MTGFETHNVTQMGSMFTGISVNELDLSSFNTEKVTSLAYMFKDSTIGSIKIGNFNTSNVTHMNSMFQGTRISKLDLYHFDTSKVESIESMFEDATATTIDTSNFDTSNVTDMGLMFKGTKVNKIILTNFNTEMVEIMTGMFQETLAEEIDTSSFNTSNVVSMYDMYKDSKVKEIDLSNFDTSRVYYMAGMFQNTMASKIVLTGLRTDSLDDANNMFSNSKVTEVDLSNISLNTSIAWTVSNPFKTGTDSTYYLKDMATINKFRAIPSLCENSTLTLKPVNIDNYYKYTLVGGGYAVSLTDGFKAALTDGKSYEKWTYGTPLPNPGKTYNNKPVISYNGTFMGLKVTELDLSLWDMNNVKDATAMFKGAEIINLKILYWKLTKAPMLSISHMFQNSKIMNEPSIGNMTIDGRTSAVDVFTGSTMAKMKVHSAMLSMWENYQTATTKVILA